MRDKRTMLVVMLIPVVLMTLFGFAISTEVNNVNVAVVAPSRTDGVEDAVSRLAANDYFTFNISKAKKYGINEKYLLPCVCRSADVKGCIFTDLNFKALKDFDK